MILEEPDNKVAQLGWMGMYWYPFNSQYLGKGVLNYGYPLGNQQCAASPLPDGTCGGFMYMDACNIGFYVAGHLLYDCDTTGGQGGSAVWRDINGGPAVLAIHKRGNEEDSGAVFESTPPTHNLGPRMRPSMFNDICGWMKVPQWQSKFARHKYCSS